MRQILNPPRLDHASYTLTRRIVFFLIMPLFVPALYLVQLHYYPVEVYGYRYIGTAYQMWHQHQFLAPIWGNNTINLQKGPLYYWLIHLSWAVFGVNRYTPFAIVDLFFYATCLLTYRIARILFNKPAYAAIAFLMLVGNVILIQTLQKLIFAIPLMFFVTLMLYSVVQVARTAKQRHWLLFSLANALTLLLKGPVNFVFAIPMCLALIMLCQNQSRWRLMGYSAGALLLGCIPVGVWFYFVSRHFGLILPHTFLLQMLQRFSQVNADPNQGHLDSLHALLSLIKLGPSFSVFTHRLFGYSGALIVGVIAFLLVLCHPRLLRQWSSVFKIRGERLGRMLWITAGCVVLFFTLCVGLYRVHYIIPLYPLITLLLAGLFARFNGAEKVQLYGAYAITLIILISTGGYVMASFYRNRDYIPLSASVEKLQSQSMSGEIYALRSGGYHQAFEGWPRFLAHSMHVTPVNRQQLMALSVPNAWCVRSWPAADYATSRRHVYPLLYPIHRDGEFIALMRCGQALKKG
ncbi:MAG: hypothetical protein COB66_05735 [Coxiella sp. (in: Bacteria)]|nr:MAG: hypothetical protein COB66_05735 [Coxiella sp. (in: g-proteobacteria)]